LAIDEQDRDVWTWDLLRRTMTRLTFEGGRNWYPAWTPDGRGIVFVSARAGVPHLYRRSADGTGTDEQLTTGKNVQFGSASLSPDGTRLVFTEVVPGTGEDVMVLSLDGSGRTAPLLHGKFAERNAAISPDGRWLAYESNESGEEEIHVRPFPNVADGGHWQVSAGGGTCPVWSPNGQELFYRDLGSVMAVTIRTTPAFSSGNPTKLLDGPYAAGLGGSYDVARDGRRFLMVKIGPASVDRAAAPARIVIVQNWLEELKAKVPTKR
jgi:serine/threonine-protein kinase